jgi:hypothetical protein
LANHLVPKAGVCGAFQLYKDRNGCSGHEQMIDRPRPGDIERIADRLLAPDKKQGPI